MVVYIIEVKQKQEKNMLIEMHGWSLEDGLALRAKLVRKLKKVIPGKEMQDRTVIEVCVSDAESISGQKKHYFSILVDKATLADASGWQEWFFLDDFFKKYFPVQTVKRLTFSVRSGKKKQK